MHAETDRRCDHLGYYPGYRGGNAAQRTDLPRANTLTPPAMPPGFRGGLDPQITALSPTLTPTPTAVPHDYFSQGSVRLMGSTYAVIEPGDIDGLEEAIDYSSFVIPTQLYRIYLLEGDYDLTHTLVVHGILEIYGRGRSKTYLKGSPSMNGIFTVPGSYLRLDNLTVWKGQTSTIGGGIHIQSANAFVEITNTRFRENHADQDGGAIYLGDGRLIIRNSVFVDNSSDRGGAIFNLSAVTDALDARWVSFDNNTASDTGGGGILFNQVAPGARNSTPLVIRNANLQNSQTTYLPKIHRHTYAVDDGENITIDAKLNFWIGPKVASDANLSGVKTISQQTTPVIIPFGTPEPVPGGVLFEYGVIVEDTAGTWGLTPADEIAMIEAGVSKTALALQAQFGGATPQDAFKRVMIASGFTRIIVNTSGTYCETSSSFANVQAQITCYNGNILSEYTVVHELGHVFTYRMGGAQPTPGTYYHFFSNPPITTTPGVLGPLLDNQNLIVFGPRVVLLTVAPGATANTTPQGDWVRGNRGWGSPAVTPPAIPCPFQQNSFVVSDWVIRTSTPTPNSPGATPEPLDTILITEIDETAADMFLNWVYRRNGQGGFINANWIDVVVPPGNCTVTPQPMPPGNDPGDARFKYMATTIMTAMNTRIPTITPTP